MGIEGLISGIADILKQAPKLFAGIVIAGGFILFAPEWILLACGLLEFRATYLSYVSVSSLLAAAFLMTHGLAFLYHEAVEWRSRNGVLTTLTDGEKTALTDFILKGESTVYFPISDGISKGLEAKGILYRSSSVGAPGSMNFPYNMQVWARKKLSKKPRLLDK